MSDFKKGGSMKVATGFLSSMKSFMKGDNACKSVYFILNIFIFNTILMHSSKLLDDPLDAYIAFIPISNLLSTSMHNATLSTDNILKTNRIVFLHYVENFRK